MHLKSQCNVFIWVFGCVLALYTSLTLIFFCFLYEWLGLYIKTSHVLVSSYMAANIVSNFKTGERVPGFYGFRELELRRFAGWLPCSHLAQSGMIASSFLSSAPISE
jgi:hypothetical protein